MMQWEEKHRDAGKVTVARWEHLRCGLWGSVCAVWEYRTDSDRQWRMCIVGLPKGDDKGSVCLKLNLEEDKGVWSFSSVSCNSVILGA